jgi:outer membrane receptor protein involved in Fe transport
MKRLTFIIMLLFPAYMLWAQQTVEGIVTDATTNETLVGVTILIKGSTVGIITDMDGHYSLASDQLNASSVLVYSYVGYTSVEETVGDRTLINVKLDQAITQLDELVVVGYGSMKKRNVLGAVTKVSSKELTRLPVAGIDQALQGRAAGVQVTQNTGAPGEGVKVRIRGVGSINSSNEPLYIVDGIATADALNILSPNDIENISILKDASARNQR